MANSFGESCQWTCQVPTMNTEAFCMALSTSFFFVVTSVSAVEILPLHSFTAFSATETFSVRVSKSFRFDSNSFRMFSTSVSRSSPSLILAFSSANVLVVDVSSEASVDRVVLSTYSLPQALHASRVRRSAMATELSSLNTLNSRS